MLFGCLPPDCKCEHVILRGLISEYNRLHGGVYTRGRRPDVEERNEMAPDLLLEGNDIAPVAIERKCVMWPVNSHVVDHRHSHDLLRCVQEAVCSKDDSFNDGLYQLRFWESSIRGLRDGEIQQIASAIAERVLENGTRARTPGGVEGSEPIAWGFGPVPLWEREEASRDSGFVMLAFGEGWRGSPTRARAREGFAGEFQRLMSDIDEKFSRYSSHRRVIALQFFGDPWIPFDDDDIDHVIAKAGLPSSVDEVWLAYHDWVSPDDYEIAWKRIWG